MRWILPLFLWHCGSNGGLCRGPTCSGPTVAPATLTVPSGVSRTPIAISVAGAVTAGPSWAAVSGAAANATLVLTDPPCGASDVTLTVGSSTVTLHVLVEDAISALTFSPPSVALLPGGLARVKLKKVSGACPAKDPITASPSSFAVTVGDATATIAAAASVTVPSTQSVTFTCGAAVAKLPIAIDRKVTGVFAEGGIDWTVSVDGSAHTAALRADGSFSVFVDSAPYSLTVKNHAAPRQYRYKNLSLAAPLLPASLALVAAPAQARTHLKLATGAGLVASFAAAGGRGDWYDSDAAGWSGSDGAPSASDGPDARWLLGPPQLSGWLDVLQTSGGFALARVPLSLLNGSASTVTAPLSPLASQSLSLSAQLPTGYTMDARTVFAVVDAGGGLPVSTDAAAASVAFPSSARVAIEASAAAASRDLLVFIADADPAQPMTLSFPMPIANLSAASGNAASTLTWSGPANVAYAVDFVSGGSVVCSAWSTAAQLALADCALAPGAYTLPVTAIGPAATLDDVAAGIADPSRFGTRVPNASNFFAIAPPMAFAVTP